MSVVGDYDGVLFDLFGTLVEDDARAVDGSIELLTGLAGQRWGIVTSCHARLAHAMLGVAGLPFPNTLIAADDVQANKPSPEGYLLGARRLGITARRCLVLEDSTAGIAAGRAAGMDVVAILRGRAAGFAAAATWSAPDLRAVRLAESAGVLRLLL